MKKRKNVYFAAAVLLFVGALILAASENRNGFGFTVAANAEKKSQAFDNITGGRFSQANDLGKNYKANPTSQSARQLTESVFDLVCVLELSESEKQQIFDQVAAAHFNGSSNIPEANVAAVINNLATIADAPAFAYTDIDQVEVTRKHLNRLMPDVVSANGGMSDVETFVVFTGLLSQKFDNEDFMVTPAQFTANLNNTTNNVIPGRPENSGMVEITQESPETYQMLTAISSYANSKNMLGRNEVISSLGIQ